MRSGISQPRLADGLSELVDHAEGKAVTQMRNGSALDGHGEVKTAGSCRNFSCRDARAPWVRTRRSGAGWHRLAGVRPCSVNAAGWRERRRLGGAKLHARLVDLLDATPCSPVMVPPTSMHSLRMREPKRTARCNCASSAASNMISGCRLPSPAWNTLGQDKFELLGQLGDAVENLAQPPARNGAVHQTGQEVHGGERTLAAGPELQSLGLVARQTNLDGAAHRITCESFSISAVTSSSVPSHSHGGIAAASSG